MRLHPRRALRIVLVVSMVLFVILNFHMIPDTSEDKLRFRDYHMIGGGVHAVQDIHVQLGNSQHVDVQNQGQGAAERRPSSVARPVHPKIVIAAGSNQTKVTSHTCIHVLIVALAHGLKKRGYLIRLAVPTTIYLS